MAKELLGKADCENGKALWVLPQFSTSSTTKCLSNNTLSWFLGRQANFLPLPLLPHYQFTVLAESHRLNVPNTKTQWELPLQFQSHLGEGWFECPWWLQRMRTRNTETNDSSLALHAKPQGGHLSQLPLFSNPPPLKKKRRGDKTRRKCQTRRRSDRNKKMMFAK